MCHQPPGTDIVIIFKSSLMRGCFMDPEQDARTAAIIQENFDEEIYQDFSGKMTNIRKSTN